MGTELDLLVVGNAVLHERIRIPRSRWSTRTSSSWTELRTSLLCAREAGVLDDLGPAHGLGLSRRAIVEFGRRTLADRNQTKS